MFPRLARLRRSASVAAMQGVELAAAGLGLVNVALVVRRSIWNYPFGIAMVALYFFVFFEARLYSDALLQIFFLAVNLYGWHNWLQARRETGDIPVRLLSNRARLFWAGGVAAASTAWGLVMHYRTDAAAPIVDAFVAGMSIGAQILMARRYLENWLVWIAVDVVAIGLYWSRDLRFTSGLYFILLLLSIAGYREWRAQQRAAA
jgi:nicotinamide mononucleotide transporter